VQVQKSAPQIGDWAMRPMSPPAVPTMNSARRNTSRRGPVYGWSGQQQRSDNAAHGIPGPQFHMQMAAFQVQHNLRQLRHCGHQSHAPCTRAAGESRRGRHRLLGRLLVPDMRSFDLNKITIEPTDIPPDTTIDDANRVVRPQDLSGVVVKFAVKVSHAALLAHDR